MKIKEFIKSIGILLLYLILPTLLQILFFNLIKNLNNFKLSIVFLIFQILITIIILLIMRKNLFKELKDFKKNFKTLIFKNFKYYVIGLVISLTINYIQVYLISHGLSSNEIANREAIIKMPLYTLPYLCLLGPLCEELIFRRNFNQVFNNKYIYLVFTSILFGGIHVLSDMSLSNILFLVAYSTFGYALGFVYKNSKNIFTSAFFHTLHNTITVIMLYIFYF